jgi:rhodanese-related sulfurtransferase
MLFDWIKQLFKSEKNAYLKDIISDGAFLVDVRTPAEFSESHISGSVNIPLNTISQRLELFRNKKHIIVFCRSGNRSTQAKMILEQNGFKQVFDGGSWKNVKQWINS